MREETENKDYTPPTRVEMIQQVEKAMNKALKKVESGRIYDPENERVRIQWIKAIGYLSNSYRQLKRDQELEELEKRLDSLEKVQEDST